MIGSETLLAGSLKSAEYRNINHGTVQSAITMERVATMRPDAKHIHGSFLSLRNGTICTADSRATNARKMDPSAPRYLGASVKDTMPVAGVQTSKPSSMAPASGWTPSKRVTIRPNPGAARNSTRNAKRERHAGSSSGLFARRSAFPVVFACSRQSYPQAPSA
eukprot:scaffold159642_cov33-Tisochrysis_lutea.AAC.5